ncbi:hypothetical protein, partial [Bacillus thuringiensis]
MKTLFKIIGILAGMAVNG